MSLPDKLNGLSTSEFPPIAFIDLDGVVFKEGTNEFIPGAIEAIRKAQDRGWQTWFFSSGLSNERMGLLNKALGGAAYFIPKPLASAYCYVDDRLNPCSCWTELTSVTIEDPKATPVWGGK